MRPSEGRISLWPLAIIAVVLVVAAFSVTRSTTLNATTPARFTVASTPGATVDNSISQRYWDVAVRVIQWKYDHASKLPEKAPTDFVLLTNKDKSNEATRAAYWAKLREEWLRPDNWHDSYHFDFSWTVKDLQSCWHGVLQLFHDTQT